MVSTPYRDDEDDDAPAKIDIHAALRAWAGTVFGAPRRLDALVTSVKARDELITRVATAVVRRDLVQERIPTHERKSRSKSSIDAAEIDPFSQTMEELRTRTEHVDRCAQCRGGGVAQCPACSGSGRQRCGNCSGSGKVLKHYKKSSKHINCSVCRGGGTVGCGGCSATGSVTCGGCSGSGQQLAWWTFRESVRVVVQISTDSPIVTAHPQLREERFLQPADLEAFTQIISAEGTGSIAGGELSPEDDAVLRKRTPALEPRLERIQAQQFLRFGVLRRDVRYEMCGMKGLVVLSGENMVGASTPKAVGPIRRRLMLWSLTSFVLLLGGAWYMSALVGPTAYFHAVNRLIVAASLIGIVAASVAVGGLLRALRPGFRFWPLGVAERISLALGAVAFVLCPVGGYFGRPSATELQQAVAAGDLDHARLVAEALKATETSKQVADAVDELELAESERLSEEGRLAKLDAIAARNGAHAGDAKTRAQRIRIEAIEAALKASRSVDAVALLERWSTELSDAPEVGDLKARVFDVEGASCTDDACRFGAARAAKAAHSSLEREALLDKTRRKLIEALDARTVVAGDLLSRVQRLRSTSKLAATAQQVAQGDDEIQAKATAASEWVRAELSKVALVGAPVPVVDELLERDAGSGSRTGWPELNGVAVYAANVGGVCTGLYIVGSTEGARPLSGKEEGLRRLIAQATGRREATLHTRPASAKTHEVSRWIEGSISVLARWKDDTLMELRIGKANP